MLRDDVIEYSLHTHHSEEEGRVKRKQILKVTVILTLITLVEVLVGAFFGRSTVQGLAWEGIKLGYTILTIIKAGYIVLSFMHLGDEKKSLKFIILIPYFLFMSYLIFILITESNAVGGVWHIHGSH
jgi:cytochrome c oxidase subunit IV